MTPDNKKRHVVSFENMSKELEAAFNEKYPRGFNDYLADIVKYPKPDGTSFYAVTIELEDAIYLVKIQIKTDDAEDIERWLNSEEEAEEESVSGSSDDTPQDVALPDDNINQYSTEEDPDVEN